MKLGKNKKSKTIDEIIATKTKRGDNTNPDLLGRAFQAVKVKEERAELAKQQRLNENSAIANNVIKSALDLDPLNWVENNYSTVRTERPVAGDVYLICHKNKPYNGSQLEGTGGAEDEKYPIHDLVDFAEAVRKIKPGEW